MNVPEREGDPARKAYDAIFSGFNPAGFAGFKRGFDAAHSAHLARIAELEGALAPFSHPDLSETMTGNIQGDDSPVFGRNKALLTLGHFRKARSTLHSKAP